MKTVVQCKCSIVLLLTPVKWTTLQSSIFFQQLCKNWRHQQSEFRAGISDVLLKYYPDSLSRFRKDGHRLEGYSSKTIYQIPVGKTRIFTFPLQPLNEAKIDDISGVMRVFTECLRYSRDDIRGKKIMFKGDQLTVKNMRYVYYCSRNNWKSVISITLSHPPASFICKCLCLECCSTHILVMKRK
jgi:hypothetical protein